MSELEYKSKQLFIEQAALAQIANQYGTPCYVYSNAALLKNWQEYNSALKQSKLNYKIYYAVKANSNISILNILAKQGAGFDAVSGGEIDRILASGAQPQQIIFSGVGKSVTEITKAINLQIHCINIESFAELQRVHEIAKQLNKTINIAFRVNPDVNPNTHPYISTGSKHNKFGVDHNRIIEAYQSAAKLSHIKITGISCHIGSQITSLDPFMEAIDQLLKIIQQLAALGINLQFIDIGGGLGIRYKDETPPTPAEYVAAVAKKLANINLELHLEPGRSIVADAGLLLTSVEYLKTADNNNFAIVDAGMNDLMRPALYQSYHEILPIQEVDPNASLSNYTIVGPVCESGDFLANDRKLDLREGDLLAILNCGAYGFSMSSNYNTRPRCAEILVDGTNTRVIRERETIEQLIQMECKNEMPSSD